MIKRNLIGVCLAIIAVALILSCDSKINSNQLKVQQKNVHKISLQIKSQINNIIHNTEQFPVKYADLQKQYNSLSAIFLLDETTKILKKFPQNHPNSTLEQLLQNSQITSKLNINNPAKIYFSSNYKHMWIFNPLQEQEKFLALRFNSYQFFQDLSQIYFPRPYNLVIIDSDSKIVFSEKTNMIGEMFYELEGKMAVHNFQHLLSKISQNDVSYSVRDYQKNGEYINSLFCWEASKVYNQKFRTVIYRYLPPKKKQQNDRSFLLASIRSYSVRDTLIKSIINNQQEKVEAIVSQIYEKNPEIYSIQYADSSGTIVYGKPRANSIVGYNYRMKMNKNFDSAFRDIYEEQDLYTIPDTLLEGGKAEIIFSPIEFSHDIVGVLIITKLNS
ncbi:MAG: hypothetical protein KGY75_07800 [Candidatus Cloacimonetes bacterium]|nr:hypothetical protein [Candidatus Cloacimonadota bacterium]MBS3768005.1 hypothetical protein [Candidatus Cloacimonadota bacterium]